jgi:hypothetical protein
MKDDGDELLQTRYKLILKLQYFNPLEDSEQLCALQALTLSSTASWTYHLFVDLICFSE